VTLDEIAKMEQPGAGVWFIRAICYDKLNQSKLALEAYQKFLELDQDKNPDQVWQAKERSRCYNACWNGKGKRMRAGGTSLGAVCGLLVFLAFLPPSVTESTANLQTRFDRETNGVHKAKLIEKLGTHSWKRRARPEKPATISPWA